MNKYRIRLYNGLDHCLNAAAEYDVRTDDEAISAAKIAIRERERERGDVALAEVERDGEVIWTWTWTSGKD